MTRDEGLDWLYRLRSEIYVYMPKEWLIPMDNAIDMAIKALEHPEKNVIAVVPCGDAISRSDVLKLMKDNWHTHNGDWAMQESMDDIRALPSVTPQLTSELEKNSKKLEKDFGELDCISKAALIERINNAEEQFKYDHMETIGSDDGDPFVDGVLSGVWNIREMVKQAPSVTPQEPRWIPTSDRLPENKTYVLVTIGIPGRQPHARSGWYQDGFFHNDNGDCWRATDIEVKAWMPLPKPYEPQESEDKE